jgi:hypothetical protein
MLAEVAGLDDGATNGSSVKQGVMRLVARALHLVRTTHGNEGKFAKCPKADVGASLNEKQRLAGANLRDPGSLET